MVRLLLVSVALLLVVAAVLRRDRGTDFDGYYEGGLAVLDGKSPYDADALERYPPAFAAAMAAFALLPYVVAIAVWSLVGVGLAAIAVEGAARIAGAEGPAMFDRRRWLPLLLASPYLVDGLLQAQSQILVLGAVVGAFWMARRGKEVHAGIAIGAAAALKLTPAIVVLYWLLRGRWRALAGVAIGAIVVGGVVPVAAYGPRGAAEAYGTWVGETEWSLRQRTPFALEKSSRYTNQSPRAAIVRLLTGIRNPSSSHAIQVNVARLRPDAALRVIAWVNGVLALVVLVALLRGRSPAIEAALVVLAMTLLSPIAWTPYFAALLVPYACLAGGRLETVSSRAAAWLTVAGSIGLASIWARAIGCVTWPSVLLLLALAWELARPGSRRS